MFPKVKNVNVKSLKNDSKLLDFWSGSLPQPLPKGKGFSKAYPNPSLKGRAFLSLPQPLPKGKGFSNFDMRGCAGGVQRSVLGAMYSSLLGAMYSSLLGSMYSLMYSLCRV